MWPSVSYFVTWTWTCPTGTLNQRIRNYSKPSAEWYCVHDIWFLHRQNRWKSQNHLRKEPKIQFDRTFSAYDGNYLRTNIKCFWNTCLQCTLATKGLGYWHYVIAMWQEYTNTSTYYKCLVFIAWLNFVCCIYYCVPAGRVLNSYMN